jgi:hypothetical protein
MEHSSLFSLAGAGDTSRAAGAEVHVNKGLPAGSTSAASSPARRT